MTARDSFRALFGALDEKSTAELDRRLDAHRVENRHEAADWFASYPLKPAASDWERGRDDTVAWAVRVLRNPDPQRGTATGEGLDDRLNEQRAMVLAEVTAWLHKKGREFYAASRKAERAQGDTCAVLASKIARGAVRPDNLRMLPDAGFFEVDHTYERKHHGDTIRFLVEYVSTSPDGRYRAAHGWRTRSWDPGWEPSDSDDLTGWTDVTEAGDRS